MYQTEDRRLTTTVRGLERREVLTIFWSICRCWSESLEPSRQQGETGHNIASETTAAQRNDKIDKYFLKFSITLLEQLGIFGSRESKFRHVNFNSQVVDTISISVEEPYGYTGKYWTYAIRRKCDVEVVSVPKVGIELIAHLNASA